MTFTADRLILFGATGDLAKRMLLPSLCALDADGLVPADLRVVCTARSPHDDGALREKRWQNFFPIIARRRFPVFLKS
jgi:glucose-6-phosphate 1-dehydrogenase